MTKSEQAEFLELIKQGSLEALKSEEGKDLLKESFLEAFKSEEGEKVFSEYFINNFKEVVVPAFENHEDRIIKMENQILTA